MNYRDADQKYFSIVEKHAPALFSSIEKTSFPQTYRALFSFCAKTNALKTALFDCVEAENPYAFQALFRCFCEHYLKFMYVWARFLEEESDSVGREYYSYCGAMEIRRYAAAIIRAERLLGKSMVGDVKRVVDELYPEASKLSVRELEKVSGRFNYHSILRFLAGQSRRLVTEERPFLARIIPAYALLSSFVHGGPYTDTEMGGYSGSKALAECEENAEVVFLMTASVFMLTAVAVSREHVEFGSVAGKVRRVILSIAPGKNSRG